MAFANVVENSLAPDVTLVEKDAIAVSLSNFRGKKVILYFYPAASTPRCTTQACELRDSMASLQSAGCMVLGLSRKIWRCAP